LKSTQTEVDAEEDAETELNTLKLLQWREILCSLVKINGDDAKENTLFARSNGVAEEEQA